jgi:hypothetical protein
MIESIANYFLRKFFLRNGFSALLLGAWFSLSIEEGA